MIYKERVLYCRSSKNTVDRRNFLHIQGNEERSTFSVFCFG